MNIETPLHGSSKPCGPPRHRADGDAPPDGSGFTLHTVTDADTLSGLAQRYLGDASRYREIVAANATMVIDPDRIYRNQILIIPDA